MKNFRVIVTGSNSFGVGEAIVKTVHASRYRRSIELVCTSCYDLFYIGHLADERHVLPTVYGETYTQSVRNLYNPDFLNIIVPGSEEELCFFAKKRNDFPEFSFLMNDRLITLTFHDKLASARHFPAYFPPTEEAHASFFQSSYPLIKKKRFGKGSESMTVCHSPEAAVDEEGFIFQAFVDGPEFTASLIQQRDSTFQLFVSERELRKGSTVKIEVVRDKTVEGWAKDFGTKVAETLGPFKVLNLQFRIAARDIRLLEINPRISGSTSLRALLGYNEFDILFENYVLGTPSATIAVEKGLKAIRGYEERIGS